VEIKDANGCTINREFSIFRQDPLEISFIESFIIDCTAKTVTKKVTAEVIGGFLPYTLSWASGTISGSNNEILTTTQLGSYELSVTDAKGCVKKKSILINEIPTIGEPDFRYSAFALTNYDLLSIEDPIQFTNLSTGNYKKITWDFGDGSPIVKEENPIHTFDSVGTYTVKITVEYDTGCSYTFDREVNITIGYILINPTAFTPNGDGYNEIIRPNFKGFTEIEMNIYSSWGTLIYYEKGTVLKGWDGTVNNTPAENGNYIMVVQGSTFYNKSITTSSPITLLK
jgi:gliding motility-associated-like protein